MGRRPKFVWSRCTYSIRLGFSNVVAHADDDTGTDKVSRRPRIETVNGGCELLRGHHSADGSRSGSTAPVPGIAEELLDPLCRIDFPCINVALAVHAYL